MAGSGREYIPKFDLHHRYYTMLAQSLAATVHIHVHAWLVPATAELTSQKATTICKSLHRQ